jgi:hypothetical protein
MFKSLSRGFDIAMASWSVLKRYPKLAVLPAVSALAFIVLFALLAGAGLMLDGHPAGLLHPQSADGKATLYALFFACYFVFFFIGIFFNAALVFCTLQAFAGHEPSLKQGLATAAGRWPQILMWTLVASTVGLLLQALKELLEEKLGFLGGMLGLVGEAAWSGITYFVVPVLVVDGVGPVEAIRRSSAILREKWGEAVTGEGGIAIASVVLIVPAVLLAAIFVGLGVPVLVLAPMILYIPAVGLLVMTLGTIFRTGVYVYATTGQAPASFGENLIQGSFRPKK